MTEREKVIKGLECCSKGDCADCDNCTYHGIQTDVPCESTLMRDAFALLKAQELVKPLTTNLGTMHEYHICGYCGGSFFRHKVTFCPWCGRAVKWE